MFVGELREYVVEELNVRALETCDQPLQYAQLRALPDWKVLPCLCLNPPCQTIPLAPHICDLASISVVAAVRHRQWVSCPCSSTELSAPI